MIISSGQILTGKAAEVITDGITNSKGEIIFKTAHKFFEVNDRIVEEEIDAPVEESVEEDIIGGDNENFLGPKQDDEDYEIAAEDTLN